jgi:WD40 repeat protein
MGRCLVVLAVLACFGVACDAHLGPTSENQKPPDSNLGPKDGPGSAGSDAAIPLGPWSTPAPVPGASSAANAEDDVTMSAGGTELYFAVSVAGANKDLYVMTRPTRSDPFGAPTALGNFNTTGNEESPRLSTDDLTIYFGRDGNIYSATRGTVGGTWGAANLVTGSGDTTAYEKWLAVCTGNHFMVSRDSGTATGQDLYEGTLGQAGSLVMELSSASSEISTFLSPDCLTVYFASNRSGTTQIYTSTRTAIGSPFAPPSLAGPPFDGGSDNEDAWISTDQRLFVFASVRNGATTKDVYISTR